MTISGLFETVYLNVTVDLSFARKNYENLGIKRQAGVRKADSIIENKEGIIE